MKKCRSKIKWSIFIERIGQQHGISKSHICCSDIFTNYLKGQGVVKLRLHIMWLQQARPKRTKKLKKNFK